MQSLCSLTLLADPVYAHHPRHDTPSSRTRKTLRKPNHAQPGQPRITTTPANP